MRILCTNDDGFMAGGLGVLAKAARSLGEVEVVAPDRVQGIKVTSLGQRQYSDSLTKTVDPKGREYFWIGGDISAWDGADDADYRAVRSGFISVTPLHLDLTDYELLEEIRRWNLAL